MSKAPPPIAWPKPYMLQVYEKALAEGWCRLVFKGEDIERQVKSFIASFYRLRRRSDTQHRSFIKPEYHLVSCTYEPHRNSVLVTFNKLPDGHELPTIESISPDEAAQLTAAPAVLGHQELREGPSPTGPDVADLDFEAVLAQLNKKGLD